MTPKISSHVGGTFGRLTVIAAYDRKLECLCFCGGKKTALACNITSGKTTSCGCLKKETAITNGRNRRKPADELAQNNPLHSIWSNMKSRCHNPLHKAFKYYGAKGITVCDRWMSFANFAADMGLRKSGDTLDRIDGNKGYSPENCRWATMHAQSRNRSNNHFVSLRGEQMCFEDAIKHLSVSRSHAHNIANDKGSKQAAIDWIVSAIDGGTYQRKTNDANYSRGLSGGVA